MYLTSDEKKFFFFYDFEGLMRFRISNSKYSNNYEKIYIIEKKLNKFNIISIFFSKFEFLFQIFFVFVRVFLSCLSNFNYLS